MVVVRIVQRPSLEFGIKPRKGTKNTKKMGPSNYGVGLVFAEGEAEARGDGDDAAGLGLAAAAADAAGSILPACEAITCHLPSRFA